MRRPRRSPRSVILTDRSCRTTCTIYAYDFNGTTIAHPVNSEKIGVNRLDELDAAGNLFIRDLRDRARDGGGFVAYYYIDPAMNRTVQPKLGYVLSVDDEWWLGSGIYGASQPDPIPCPALYATTENVTTDQLTAFVEDAADFARDAGRIRALRAFNNLSGPYVRYDLYIFAYDNEGTILALPYESDLIGSSRYDATDSNGVFYIREGIEKAGAGGGFISYTYVDPATGEETWKRSYVTPVDDRWWIGAGIYETAPAS